MSGKAEPTTSMADVLRQRHRAHASRREAHLRDIEANDPGAGPQQLDVSALKNAGGGLFLFNKFDLFALGMMTLGFLLVMQFHFGVDVFGPLWDVIKPAYDTHLLADDSGKSSGEL